MAKILEILEIFLLIEDALRCVASCYFSTMLRFGVLGFFLLNTDDGLLEARTREPLEHCSVDK